MTGDSAVQGEDAEGRRDDAEEVGGDRDPVRFDSSTPPAEWALAAVGCAFAILMIGLLVQQAFQSPDTPPALSAEVLMIVPRGEGHLVEAEISNTGGSAARTVLVEGRLIVDGAVLEQSDAQLDYLPGGATRSVGLVFEEDPAQGRVEVAPLGFTE